MKIRSLSLSLPRYMKSCAICIGVVFMLEIIIFNISMLYLFWSLKDTISSITNAPGSLIDKLAVVPTIQDIIHGGKEGGFSSLIQHTLGRLYIESIDSGAQNTRYHYSLSNNLNSNCSCSSSQISTIGLDVSNAGEALYILKRVQRLKGTGIKWKKLVVDIGANDGLMSSNSYNFIKWGWSGILVEPQDYQLSLARRNLNSFMNQHDEQHVEFLRAVIDDHDGFVNFKLSKDIVSMESHVVRGHTKTDDSDVIVRIKCFSVHTFAISHNIPKSFGILSIDAEGSGSKILHQWIKLGYRPIYIIYEALHDSESMGDTKYALEQAGYIYLVKLGWNFIFEYGTAKGGDPKKEEL